MQFPLQNILKAYVLLDDLHWILSSEYYSLNSPLWQNLRSTQPKLALPVTMNAIRRARGVWTIGQSNQKLWFRRLSATLSGLMLDRAILRPCHHCTEHFSSEISFSKIKNWIAYRFGITGLLEIPISFWETLIRNLPTIRMFGRVRFKEAFLRCNIASFGRSFLGRNSFRKSSFGGNSPEGMTVDSGFLWIDSLGLTRLVA